MEFKKADSEGQLEEKAKEALQQIAEKAYASEMQDQAAGIWQYGIAFWGKKVAMACKEQKTAVKATMKC